MNETIKTKAQELYPIESRANEHTAFLQGKIFAISKLEEFISDKRKMFGLIGHKEEFINCFKRYVEE